MKKRLYLLLVLPLIAIILFLIPVKEQTFEELFTGEEAIKNSLLTFREKTTKSLEVNGTSWEYLATGNGEKSLLLLHGMGGVYDIWWQQIESLQNEFRIISIALPEVNTLSEAIKGLRSIMDHEGIEKTSILGTSMGGYIAQYFLQVYPKKLDKLVLGNTFPPNQIFKAQNEGLRRWLPYIPEWIIMRTFRKNASEKVVPASENSALVQAYLHEQYSGYMSKPQFIGRLDIVLEFFDPNYTMIHVDVPKLIIESDNDPLVPPELRGNLKRLYPEAQVFTFHGKGHFPYLNRPERYSETLRKFLGN